MVSVDGVPVDEVRELVYVPRFVERVGESRGDAVEGLRSIPAVSLRRVLDFLHAELLVSHVKFAVPTSDGGSILGNGVALATTVGQVNELNRLVEVFDGLLREKEEVGKDV